MHPLINHQYIGPTPETRHEIRGLSSEEAYRLIGVNTLAGFEPVLHTHTAQGRQLTTPDGKLLTVVALHSSVAMSALGFESAVMSVLAFEQV
ncbi:hypothetical protein [Streptomyces chattanoogensis]|uniref:hypothetical protein n=1 Tax=Streptomyces chattanoogensis TaxID=66876 RepID=UPI0036D1C61F